MPKKPKVLPSLLEIRYMIIDRPDNVTFVQLANVSGTTAEWVSKLSRGKISNPGYQRVAAIYQYLMAVS